MKISQILPKIRSLVNDPQGQFVTADYVLPLVQLSLDLLTQEVLTNPNMETLCAIVVIPNVPAGTTSLQSYFAAGHPLELLTNIVSMKERPSQGSRQEQDWIMMDESFDPPTINSSAFSRFYTFTPGVTILIPPADQIEDFRIFGKFQTVPLTSMDSPIPPGINPILEFRTGALIAASRGNAQLKVDYNTWADRAQSSYVANLIMEMQKIVTRQQPFSGRSSRLR